MKLFYNALAVGLLLAGFGCIAYGVMVGFGGGINQANTSNAILRWAVPVALGAGALAVLLFWIANRVGD